MSGPEGPRLFSLSARRDLQFPNGVSLRTPLIVPSFSSRVDEVEKPFKASQEFLDGAFLVSAFDIAKGLIGPPFDFAEAVFLDSGGYEIGPGSDLSDVSSGPRVTPPEWTTEQHQEVVSNWTVPVPTIVITYDHPKIRVPVAEQILRGKALSLPNENCLRELLIKPETPYQNFVKLDSIVANVRDLFPFRVVGVTEKEIGNSVLDRMVNIARIRLALNNVGLNIPIHIFGSLDSITTLYYFVAGADIFDGLTWLRYAFKDGHTIYRQDYGISDLGITTKAPKVDALCWSKNHQYMREMELEMRRFLNAHDFGAFRFHGPQLKAAFESVQEELTKGVEK
jgi:hypothetical protein